MSAREQDLIDSLDNGYRDAQILHTAVRLDLFSTIGKEAITSDALATRLGTDQRATRILCDALAALGLLRKRDGAYRNGSEALESLIDGSPKDRRAILLHNAKLYYTWGTLPEVVRGGAPVEVPVAEELEHGAEGFARAMADIGRMQARETLRSLDLKKVKRVLDGGGGPGVYSMAFAQHSPELAVTLFDNAETLAVAKANIAAAGLLERIELRPGDILTDPLGGPYDLIFLSNLVHCFDASTNAGLVARCAAALQPGGRLCIKDFALNEDRVSPPGAAIFAVNMLVNTESGDCYSESQIAGWYKAVGLKPLQTRQVGVMSRLILGEKPA